MHPWNLAAYAGVLVINGLAGSTTRIGGQRTGDVARKHRTFCDPSPFAFSIWGVIYTAMGVYVVVEPQQSPIFLAICAANVSWLFLWGNEMFLLSQPLIYAYGTLTFLHLNELRAITPHTFAETIAYEVFPALHLGWLVCACTVSTPLVFLACTGIRTPAALTSALLLVPLLVAHVGVRSRVAVCVTAWAANAIRVEQGRRLALPEGPVAGSPAALPASNLIVAVCSGIMALCAVSLAIL